MKELQLGDVLARFAAADSSWLSTIREGDRPHAAPVWHVWTGGRFYVVTKPEAVKVANIRHKPAVVLTHPDPHAVIIIEGYATIVEEQAERLRPLFLAKYDWDIVADEEYKPLSPSSPRRFWLGRRRAPRTAVAGDGPMWRRSRKIKFRVAIN